MIRATTLLDIPNILTLTRTFYEQTSYNKWAAFDDESVTTLINALRTRGILFVAQVDDALVGIIGAMSMPYMFNTEFTSVYEVIWYVDPAHRKTSLGIDLLKRADQMCALKGWKSFQMTRLEESSPKLDDLFIAEGFHPTEHSFTKVY